MKRLFVVFFPCLLIFFNGCNKNSDIVNNPYKPPLSNWALSYKNYSVGTMFCNSSFCDFPFQTDTIDITNKDSIKFYMRYTSIFNNSFYVLKNQAPFEIYDFTFPDSTTGIIDTVFASYKTKIVMIINYDVATRLSIDSLQVWIK